MEPTTINPDQIVKAHCDHCEAETMQVLGGSGLAMDAAGEADWLSRACLQCIADGGNCCSLAPLNRRL